MSKNKVGQPLKFESPEELQERIEEYFIWAKKNKRHITITDLAYYLGTNRTTLLNYENSMENDWLKSVDDDVKVRYVNTIKRAKARIEAEYEQGLFNKNSVVGTIFTLKNNYNWVDKQEIEQTNKTIEVSLED
ncbi:MAG: terminase small subunit [Clostridium sp.]|nr:terminase small subunit [Clostridium sp.]